ncbi:MAG TPA: DUF4276 family protein [Thermoanaerobaculia bacterium]|nr:DUF4276 family protein [Thermoanaerobaculia bacterium]
MHLETLVEERSAEAALSHLLPRILGPEISFAIYSHRGKMDLLAKLPQRMRGYARWMPDNWRILILTDADGRDCLPQKEVLESVVRASGLLTRSSGGPGGRFQVSTRLAIEELEAWFLGDVEALCSAYPRLSPTLAWQAPYRDPDAVRGGTWEALERELQRAGYHAGGLSKIKAAREISVHMDPARNRSRSFQVFREGLLKLISG